MVNDKLIDGHVRFGEYYPKEVYSSISLEWDYFISDNSHVLKVIEL